MLSFRLNFEVDEESKTDRSRKKWIKSHTYYQCTLSRLFKFSDLLIAFCVTKELVCLKLKKEQLMTWKNIKWLIKQAVVHFNSYTVTLYCTSSISTLSQGNCIGISKIFIGLLLFLLLLLLLFIVIIIIMT